MPVDVLKPRSNSEWIIPVGALHGRIDRHLRKLTPRRELYYDHHVKNSFVRIQNGAEPRQGPYYYEHYSGLARMLGLFHIKGVNLPSVTAIDRRGNEYPEKPLPPELRFEAMTEIMIDAKLLLERHGYTVILNDNKITLHAPDVTGAVITDYGGEEPNPGLDISDEEIACLERMKTNHRRR